MTEAPGTTLERSDPEPDCATQPGEPDARARYIRVSVFASLLALIPFVAVLWNFGVQPLRTARPQGIFSDFYDVQARALMNGRLAVPPGSLRFEAFIVDGSHYMYFPPLPALLRIPVFAVTDAFDGRLTAISMLVAWLVTTSLISLFVWRVRTIVWGAIPLGRLEACAYGIFIFSAAGGSILVYVASLPWVYHEAYAWSVATVLGSVFALAGLIDKPTWRAALATGLWTAAAVLTRTTGGWACAVAVLLTAAWFISGRRGTEARRWSRTVVLAGVVPILLGAAVNWAKFRHPWMFPLDRQVWTELSEQRQRALEVNDGTLIGPQFFTTSLVNYLRPDGIRFMSIFPYVSLPALPARGYNGAFLDQSYRTGSVPAFMPALFGLSLWGLFTTFRRRSHAAYVTLRLPVLGTLGVTAGVMFFGYVGHRYNAEFFPVLVVAGSVGLVDLARRLDGAAAPRRRTALVALLVAVLFGAYANVATGLYTARLSARGESLREYVIVQQRSSNLTGDPLDERIDLVESLPESAPADSLFVVGDCDALYLATGERNDMWTVVEAREGLASMIVTDRVPGADRASTSSVPLFEFAGGASSTLSIERRDDESYQLVLDGADDRLISAVFDAAVGSLIEIAVLADTEVGVYTIEGPGSWSHTVLMSPFAPNSPSRPTVLRSLPVNAERATAAGLELVSTATPVPTVCDDLGKDRQ